MRPPAFAELIGLPWVAGAQGPDAYDCMGFFRFVQGAYFHRQLPEIIAPNVDDPACLTSLFARHPLRGEFVQVPAPMHGCAVIARGPLHIGTWLQIDGGGVLHCVRGVGVIFTPDAAWPTSGFGRREFFEYCP